MISDQHQVCARVCTRSTTLELNLVYESRMYIHVCVCMRVLPSLDLNCSLTAQVCYKCQLQQTYHKCFVESPTTCNDPILTHKSPHSTTYSTYLRGWVRRSVLRSLATLMFSSESASSAVPPWLSLCTRVTSSLSCVTSSLSCVTSSL